MYETKKQGLGGGTKDPKVRPNFKKTRFKSQAGANPGRERNGPNVREA